MKKDRPAIQKVFWIAEGVNNETLGDFGKGVVLAAGQLSGKDQLTIVLHSSGGDVYAGLGIYDVLRSIVEAKPDLLLRTVAVGYVASIMVPIFLAGEYRVITPNSSLKLHELATHFKQGGCWSLTECQAEVSDLDYLQEQYIRIVTERSDGKLNERQVLDMIRKSTMLPAERVVTLGLAHEIGPIPLA